MRDIAQEVRNTVILMKAAGWSDVTFYGRSMEGESNACVFTHSVPGFGRVPNLYEKPNWHLAWEIIQQLAPKVIENRVDSGTWWTLNIVPGSDDGARLWLDRLVELVEEADE